MEILIKIHVVRRMKVPVLLFPQDPKYSSLMILFLDGAFLRFGTNVLKHC